MDRNLTVLGGALIVVVMGVTGSGKTTVGELLAKRLGVPFQDADDYHTAANKARMAAGHALTDEDREPWLKTLHGVLAAWAAAGTGGVLACSALKVGYRRTLSEDLGGVRFVLLTVPPGVLAARLAQRRNHFMNPALLESQIHTLETDRALLLVENCAAPEAVVEVAVTKLEQAE